MKGVLVIATGTLSLGVIAAATVPGIRDGVLNHPLRTTPSNPSQNLMNLPPPDLSVRYLCRLLGS